MIVFILMLQRKVTQVINKMAAQYCQAHAFKYILNMGGKDDSGWLVSKMFEVSQRQDQVCAIRAMTDPCSLDNLIQIFNVGNLLSEHYKFMTLIKENNLRQINQLKLNLP